MNEAQALQITQNALDSQQVTIQNLKDFLAVEANQLDRWAAQSISGGWSTHQVEPMRKRADEIRRLIS